MGTNFVGPSVQPPNSLLQGTRPVKARRRSLTARLSIVIAAARRRPFAGAPVSIPRAEVVDPLGRMILATAPGCR